jgi:hypothetical protein
LNSAVLEYPNNIMNIDVSFSLILFKHDIDEAESIEHPMNCKKLSIERPKEEKPSSMRHYLSIGDEEKQTLILTGTSVALSEKAME